jgi:hypothetical protein
VDGLSIPRTSKQVIYDQIIGDIIQSIPDLRTSNSISYSGAVTQSAAHGILARIYLFRAGENKRDAAVGLPLTNTEDSIKAYFQHARDWAMKVKESGIHGLAKTYKNVFVDLCSDKYNSSGVLETIWEIEEAGSRQTPEQAAGRIGNVIGFGATNDYSTVEAYKNLKGMSNPGYSYKFIYASLKLFEMYESEGDTARGDWNIANYEYTYNTASPNKEVTGRKYYFGKLPAGLTTVEGFPCIQDGASTSNANKTRCAAKYRRESEAVTPKNKNWTPINFPVLRYSDILLMIAEAENELSPSPTNLAYECLDAVRVRASISPMSGNGLTKEQFREVLKKERAMEFCFEATRRWDLIRWGDFHTAMNGMQSYVDRSEWGAAYKYAANYYKVSKYYNYYPIPDMEMAINKSITQNNPGW